MTVISLVWKSSFIRVIFRIYFTLIILILNLVGDKCCDLKVKIQLLRNNRVDVMHTTGWLRGFTPMRIFMKTRKMPVGWLGLLMIFCTVFTLVADLAVAGLVRDHQIVSRCDFSSGLVFDTTGNSTSFYPSYNFPAFYTSLNAQIQSAINNGSPGIYRKANSDPRFRADPELDVLGRWNCRTLGTNNMTFAADESPDNIKKDLLNAGILYEANRTATWLSGRESVPGFVEQLIFISSSTSGQPSRLPWDIRIAIDATAVEKISKIMMTFECSVVPLIYTNYIGGQESTKTILEGVLSQISANETLTSWIPMIQGSLYGGFDEPLSPDTGTILEQIFNSMIMVSGGGSTINSMPHEDSGTTQGCLVQGTKVPAAMVITFSLITIVTFAMVIYCSTLAIRMRIIKSRSNNQNYNRAIFDRAPNGLLDWMEEAVRNKSCGETVRAKDLREYSFGPTSSNQVLDVFYAKNDFSVHGGYTTSARNEDVAVTEYKGPVHRVKEIFHS